MSKESPEDPTAVASTVTAADDLVPHGDERRARMLAVIQEQAFARVSDLSDRFGISEVTVRNDLAALASGGDPQGPGWRDPSRRARARAPVRVGHQSRAEKLAIGRAAADVIGDGDSVIIDVGTTAVAAAHALGDRTELRDVVVFTNGLKTALELEHAVPRITVVVLGGTLRPLQHSLVDPLATHILERVSVETLLLGCNGVHPTGGVTNINLPEAEIKRRMLEIASRRIVLADGSKIGRIELAHLCRADEVDMVITGESANEAIVESLREHCEVLVAR